MPGQWIRHVGRRGRGYPRFVGGYVIPADAARAVGRFRPGRPLGYRAADMPDAPIRATRAEAVADWLAPRLDRV